MQHENIYSDKVLAGNRTYFFNIKKTVEEKYYIQITESRKVEEGKFEKHNIIFFQKDIPYFHFAFIILLKKFK